MVRRCVVLNRIGKTITIDRLIQTQFNWIYPGGTDLISRLMRKPRQSVGVGGLRDDEAERQKKGDELFNHSHGNSSEGKFRKNKSAIF